MAKKTSHGSSQTQPFVSVLKPTLREPAWKDLRFGARCLYITVKSFYNGNNNGQLYLSVRKAADELGAAPSSVAGWFKELIDHGFIAKTGGGHFNGLGQGTATYWRLTELGCLGAQPTRDYKNWQPAKNKNPYQKSVQTVPKSNTPRTENQDRCTENQYGNGLSSTPDCTDNQYISTCHTSGDDHPSDSLPSSQTEPSRSQSAVLATGRIPVPEPAERSARLRALRRSQGQTGAC